MLCSKLLLLVVWESSKSRRETALFMKYWLIKLCLRGVVATMLRHLEAPELRIEPTTSEQQQ